MDYLEGHNATPGDKIILDTLETFDPDSVRTVWGKALARRDNDPEGAITLARTLLETVVKRILDECDEPYSVKGRFAETVFPRGKCS